MTDLGSFPGRSECSQLLGDFQMPIGAPPTIAEAAILPFLRARAKVLKIDVPEQLSVEGALSYVVVNSETHEPLFQCILKPSPLSEGITPLSLDYVYKDKMTDKDIGLLVVQIAPTTDGKGFDVTAFTGQASNPEFVHDRFAEPWELRGHDNFWDAFKSARRIAIRCRHGDYRTLIDFDPSTFEF